MRAPTPRRLTLLAAVGGIAAAGAAVLLAASPTVSIVDAVQLATAVLALAGLAVVVLSVRRLDGKVQRLIVKHREHANFTLAAQRQARAFHADVRPSLEQTRERSEEILGALGEDRVEAITRTGEMLDRADDHAARLADIRRHLGPDLASSEPKRAAQGRRHQPSGDVEKAAQRLVERLADAGYSQVEMLSDLCELLSPRVPMPSPQGWVASPQALRFVIETVWRHRPKLVVECGSGSATAWLGYVMERSGAGKVVSLEHEARIAEISRDLVRAHGLGSAVEVRFTPLEPWTSANREYLWYAARDIEDLTDIGLLLVDGPIAEPISSSHYPVIPFLQRCAQDAKIILVNTGLADEAPTITDRWLTGNGLIRHVFDNGRDTHILARSSP